MEYSVSIGAAKLDGRRISFPDFIMRQTGQFTRRKEAEKPDCFYDQIKENQEPETADPVEPILAQGNENPC